jgi:hypothetical protein
VCACFVLVRFFSAPASARLYKPSPIEDVDELDHLLVTGEEAARTGFPVAPCVWGASRFPEPPPLLNKRGALNKSDCGPPPPPPPPPGPPGPPTQVGRLKDATSGLLV